MSRSVAGGILVTGGSGFIGTNLVQALIDDGVDVLSLDRSPPLQPRHETCWRRVEILDVSGLNAAFRDFRPWGVVHLAARTDLDRDTSLEDYAANTRGTEVLLDAVERTGSVRRLLVASSMLVCRLGYVPRSDEDYAPDTRYGESKVLTEKITRQRNPAVTWALVRPTTIWGPWHLRLEREFFRVLRRGRYVHPRGRPCRRSYGFVGNSVHQIRRLLEASPERIHGRTFYLGDPAVELLDFINGFARRLTGREVRTAPYSALKAAARAGDLLTWLGWKNAPLTSYRLSNMTRDNVLDVGPTLAVTGANPFSLEAGIDATVAWLDSRASAHHA